MLARVLTAMHNAAMVAEESAYFARIRTFHWNPDPADVRKYRTARDRYTFAARAVYFARVLSGEPVRYPAPPYELTALSVRKPSPVS